jgi:hypothetical protein
MTACQFPSATADDRDVADILARARTIAIVGLSHKVARDSHRVARYLQDHGYRIIPVNPKYREVLGEKCYPSLREVPEAIDIVDVFRNVAAIPAIVAEAIAVRAGCVWMQLGLEHREAAAEARAAGLRVVMNECIMIAHARLCGS